MNQRLIFHLIFTLLICGSSASHWSYSKTAGWRRLFQECGGHHQSPVNIEPLLAKRVVYKAGLTLGRYDQAMTFIMKNDGHTVVFEPEPKTPRGHLPYLQNGGLPGRYILSQLHFHWGGDSSRGSEHRIAHKQFSAELHLVHYNEKYGSFNSAIRHPDGLAVLAVLYKVEDRDNANIEPIIQQLRQVERSGSQTRLEKKIKLDIFLPSDRIHFYRYHGSLTTPNCREAVVWTVFDTPVLLSERQIMAFRQLKDAKSHRLVDDFRPIQPFVRYHRHLIYSTTPKGRK